MECVKSLNRSNTKLASDILIEIKYILNSLFNISAPEIYDPGEPMVFSVVTDKQLQIKYPTFKWVRGKICIK